ncbi:MAG: lipid A deacylase LpxR family protein [Gammaproteobacteria bacterium]|nr:lipid A deacylase LpxR family protein [Gammaproteobacteria bacterium]NVK88347.1 lipid A deacylase LpxR family protein [Gammaproteobacteria bacterium]
MSNTLIRQYGAALCVMVGLLSPQVHAEPNKWRSFTLDNDIFLGDDSGYSNGLHFSQYHADTEQLVDSGWLNSLLTWSIDTQNARVNYRANTFGQIIVTPVDIEEPALQEDDIPYSGLLYFNQAYVIDHGEHADRISTLIGLIGPNSGAANSQRAIHKLTGSDIPQGWDNQLGNEIVFQFSRGRAWRNWVSDEQNFDLITTLDGKLGTLETSLSSGLMMRYGRDIQQTYSSALLNDERNSNPVNIEGGWFFYVGLEARYTSHLIYLDGNNFKDSHSVSYEPFQFNGFIGYSYAWQDVSISVAVNNIDTFGLSNQGEDVKQYGTITFLWRI